MKKNRTFLGLTVPLAALLLTSAARASTLSIDNFEGYTNNQQLSSGTQNAYPYFAYGAVGNQLTAKTAASGTVLDGNLSGAFGVAISAGNGTKATLQYQYSTPIVLSSYKTVSFASKSNAATSNAVLALILVDGTTNYVSTTTFNEGTTAQTFTYSLSDSFTNTSGTLVSLSTTLSNLTAIGFRITSTISTDTESLVFDDFTASTPEPSSFAFVAVLAVGGVLRRRRA